MTRTVDFRRATDDHLQYYAARMIAIGEMLKTDGAHIRASMATAADIGYPAKASGADTGEGGGGSSGNSAVESAVIRPDRVAEHAQCHLSRIGQFLPMIDEIERVLASHVPDPGKRGTKEVCGTCWEPMGGYSRCQARVDGRQCRGLAAGKEAPPAKKCSTCGVKDAAAGRSVCEGCKTRARRGHHTVADYRDMTGVIAVDDGKPVSDNASDG